MSISLRKNLNNKSKKRKARGISAGRGMTAGRGTKGQKSRSGHNIPKRFEGGQTPLGMRLPKLKGFKSSHKKDVIVYLSDINLSYKDGETVSKESLIEKGIIKKGQTPKVLNNGELKVNVKLDGVKTSKSIFDKFKTKATRVKKNVGGSKNKEGKEKVKK